MKLSEGERCFLKWWSIGAGVSLAMEVVIVAGEHFSRIHELTPVPTAGQMFIALCIGWLTGVARVVLTEPQVEKNPNPDLSIKAALLSKVAVKYYAIWFAFGIFAHFCFTNGKPKTIGEDFAPAALSMFFATLFVGMVVAALKQRIEKANEYYYQHARIRYAKELLGAIDQWENATIDENDPEIAWLVQTEVQWPKYVLQHVLDRYGVWPLHYREHMEGVLMVNQNYLDALRKLGHPISDTMTMISFGAKAVGGHYLEEEDAQTALEWIKNNMPSIDA